VTLIVHNTTLSNNFNTLLLAVNPAIAYHVVGFVFEKESRFMLDAGTAISLISIACGRQ